MVDPYEERKEWKRRIMEIVGPAGIRVSLVWQLNGGISLIWYWGKSETGFASGRTPELAAESAFAKVFGGL